VASRIAQGLRDCDVPGETKHLFKTNMSLTFLHVSDLHLRKDWPAETDLILKKFFEDLRVQFEKFENLYLAFTGDFVQSGEHNEYFEYFNSKFTHKLDEFGITKSRRFCVPGNHDVSRNAFESKVGLALGAIKGYDSEEVFNSEFNEISPILFEGKFENYQKFESDFAEISICTKFIGGGGREISEKVGVYCLNTALCSFGGAADPKTGAKISDEGLLSIDTRTLHQWINETDYENRVLLMHHPSSWLSPWAKEELETIIADEFDIVLFGHEHRGLSGFHQLGERGEVKCLAPPLFTRKSKPLAYSFVSMHDDGAITIEYRQWSAKSRKFILGTELSGSDSGQRTYRQVTGARIPDGFTPGSSATSTQHILEDEFVEASTCCSSKKQFWVDRDFSQMPETDPTSSESFIQIDSIRSEPQNFILRAPNQFGLSSIGRKLALDEYLETKKLLLFLDLNSISAKEKGVKTAISQRKRELLAETEQVTGFILDGWTANHTDARIVAIISDLYPDAKIIILDGIDDFIKIATTQSLGVIESFKPLYLRALSRARIRELVSAYLDETNSPLGEDLVTSKLINDVDGLNMHRTPINFLLLLRLLDRALEESPVNRTEVISNVFHSLFTDFDDIPKYSEKPDLKDCNFALGYLCESLLRKGEYGFSKKEFEMKVSEYVTAQWMELDVGILFSFLYKENILVHRNGRFQFRLSYWFYYFAAQRMHHSKEFSEYVLSDFRYSEFPEIVEFYTGIDRRRTDAVVRLTKDLDSMDRRFLERTLIPSDFDPFREALWNPDGRAIEAMHSSVTQSIKESSLPIELKDAVADGRYDPAVPYNQEINQFIQESSLRQMVQAMRGAARALRNSDHVAPEAKVKLFEAVMRTWKRMAQTIALISPILATHRQAAFEGFGFQLDGEFDVSSDAEETWRRIMMVVVDNVVDYYQDDVFSRKLSQLYQKYMRDHRGSMSECMVLLLFVRRRPPGWHAVIDSYIRAAPKNSFLLNRVYSGLEHEYRYGYVSEGTRQSLRTLWATVAAKHFVGSKNPSKKLVSEVADNLDSEIKGFEEAEVPPQT